MDCPLLLVAVSARLRAAARSSSSCFCSALVSTVLSRRGGMSFTLLLTAFAATGGIFFGTLLALMRLSGLPPLSLPAAGYVNLMRSVPLVLMIFWFYFLVPYIGQWITGAPRPIQVGAFVSSLVTFTLFEAAYYCEIMVFERGKPKGKLERLGRVTNRRGTKVRFRPDPQIFGANARFRPERVFKMTRSKAYLFGGVEIRWSCR